MSRREPHAVEPPRLHRAGIWRGHLLRALDNERHFSSGAAAVIALEATELALLFGYGVRADIPEVRPQEYKLEPAAETPAETAAAQTVEKPKLRATMYQVTQVPTNKESADSAQPAPIPLVKLPLADRKLKPPIQRLLVPDARLAAFVRRNLRQGKPGNQIDLLRWIALVARAEVPKRLPKRMRNKWGAHCAVIVNNYGDCEPIREDLNQLVQVVQLRSGGATPIYLLDPEGQLWRRKSAKATAGSAWRECAPDTPLQHRHWLWAGADPWHEPLSNWRDALAAKARGAGVTWLTLAAADSAALPGAKRVTWEFAAALRVQRGPAAAVKVEQVERLLTAMAFAIRIEPALLRELRLLLRLSVATELAAWQHPDSQSCPIACWLRQDAIAARRAAALQLPESLRTEIARTVAGQHHALSPLIQAEESALASVLAPGACIDRDGQLWANIVATLRANNAQAEDCARYVRRIRARAHPEFWRQNEAIAEAWLLSERDSLQEGGELPEGISGELAARVLAEDSAHALRSDWSLVQNRERLQLVPGVIRHRLARLTVAGSGIQIGQNGSLRRVALSQGAGLGEAQLAPIMLWHADERIEILHVDRPAWAQEFGRDRAGVYALTPAFAGTQAKFHLLPPEQACTESPFLRADEDQRCIEFVRGKVLCRLGFDLAFGAFAELQIGKAVQRFRWVSPGKFWMGSPDNEPERDSDEGPRHVVRISQGFWLADTACTQALWRAVMDQNPSHFEGDELRPVDSVSWLDAQKMFKQMAELGLPGADLPTEAQWEYACRSGTQTPFHFGAQIDPGKANYDGNFPYAGGEKGEYRECTVAVKALPANDWGLFQMHGNVWEWCKDGLRDYVAHGEAVSDPEGPQGKDAQRALRGGSWLSDAGDLRAAYRSAYLPEGRSGYWGLRLVLRSTSPDQTSVAAEPPLKAPAEQAAGLGAAGGGVGPAGRRAGNKSEGEHS